MNVSELIDKLSGISADMDVQALCGERAEFTSDIIIVETDYCVEIRSKAEEDNLDEFHESFRVLN